MSMMITTCQLNSDYARQLKTDGWTVFDCTVGTGGDKAAPFAPSWDMVRGYAAGKVSEDQYTHRYHKMMQDSYVKNRYDWEQLIRTEKLALACYCKVDAFCHRHLLAEYITKAARARNIKVQEVLESPVPAGDTGDGVTHINIYSKGLTKLGRWMSNFAHTPITIGDTTFASIEAYWYWLGIDWGEEHNTEDERNLVEAYGFLAKKVGRDIRKCGLFTRIERPDFLDLIRDAIWVKINSYPEYEKMLRKSTLPFQHYYVVNGQSIEAGHEDIVEIWEEARAELQHNEPDYEPDYEQMKAKWGEDQALLCSDKREDEYEKQLELMDPLTRGYWERNGSLGTFNKVTTLKKDEVFVFGSNEKGFHGAGTAGLAMRNDPANTWRDDKAFIAAMNAPVGSPARVGHWAVYGVGRGHQVGKNGESYAVATVTRPGAKRSIPLHGINRQLRQLMDWAREHPEKTVYCAINGGGYNGYTKEEIATAYPNEIPPNVLVPEDLVDLLS